MISPVASTPISFICASVILSRFSAASRTVPSKMT
jgi:hypothetical protein